MVEEKVKLSLFVDDMTLYVENAEGNTQNQIELIRKHS